MPKFRTFLLIVMMLWLPLKGVVAVAMPTCPDHAPMMQTASELMEHGGCHGADMGSDDADTQASHLNCDHCMNCYLSVAPFLTVQPILTASPQPGVPVTAGAESFLSYTPDPLDRPPLAS